MFEKLFFRTIVLYYKDRDVTPENEQIFTKLAFMHAVTFGMHLIFLRYAVAAIIFGREMYKVKYTKPEVFGVLIGATLLVYFLFLRNKKYWEIYNRYKDDQSLRTRRSKLIIISYFLISVASPFVLGIALNYFWFA